MPAEIRSVLMLSQNFHPVIGGSERQALELSSALARRGLAVTVLTRQPGGAPPEEEISGVRVLRLDTRGPLDTFRFMLRVFFHLLSSRYDAVHVHLAASTAVAAVAAGWFTGVKPVIKLGGGKGVDEITRSGGTLFGRLKLLFFRLARPAMLVMNREVHDWLKSEPGWEKVPLSLFRNGVDTGRFTPPLYHEKIKAKEALGLDNRLLFLFVGRLSPEKRVREFLEAWAEMLSESTVKPEIQLLIVGEGPLAAELNSAVASMGLSGSVKLAGRRDDLLPYYRAADVFILPSISEGLSNSMLEAMACGVAVLASRVGGAKEALEDGVSGCLFEPLNRAALKECLRTLASDRNVSVRLGEAARKIAVERYSMARVVDDLLGLYKGKN